MCRRELDKAESEIKKNSSIIGDYKQVSSFTRAWVGDMVGRLHSRLSAEAHWHQAPVHTSVSLVN